LLSQFVLNFDYLKSVFKRNERNLEEDNRISESMMCYLKQETDELKKMVESTEKRLEKIEKRSKKSIKKA